MAQSSVLVVDDEPAIRECISRLLSRAGWRVVTAASCAEARMVLSTVTPDAAIFDVRMPDGGDGMSSGLDLLACVRRDPGLEAMPVIILTGYFLSAQEDAAIRRQGATVLYKPADLRTISARLSALRVAADASASKRTPPWHG